MADPVVSPVLQVLADRLKSLASAYGNNRTMQSLRFTLGEILSLVCDAEDRSIDTRSLRNWLTNIKNAAYDADDLLDDFEHLKTPMTKKKVSSYISLSRNPLVYSIQFDRKMKEIQQRFKQLLIDGSVFHLVVASKTVNTSVSSSTKVQTTSFIPGEIFGREEDKRMIITTLFRNHLRKEVCVVPIVGMGGIGKTTLAQLVFNDELVKAYFDYQVWICVGDEFDVEKIGESIVFHYLVTVDSTFLQMEDLESLIRGLFGGRKILIVLDDVWNENLKKWEILKRWFSVGAPGSCVIVTTRSSHVASMIGTVPAYCLTSLSQDHCWALFRRLTFVSTEEENVHLEEIGRKIVTRCRGLPLAIESLGGLLRRRREVSEWLSILNHYHLKSTEFQFEVLQVLKLSYDHLPSHLKQCFAYCSIFAKGYWINREKLIRLWIAQGCIRYTSGTCGTKRPEDIADEYLMELLQRSFFQEITRDDHESIVEFRMHDLVHDLALSVAGIECSIVGIGNLHTSENLRHASLVCESGPSTIPEALFEAKRLRSLLISSGKFEDDCGLYRKIKYLRVLDLSQSGIHELSLSIAALKHLRYLDLSCTRIRTIPEYISRLKNLQTLDLSKCYTLLWLPKAICQLKYLRHLNIWQCCSLSLMPSGIGKLSNLQTLPAFILGKGGNCARLCELSGLDLKGRLEIKNLENVKNLADAREAKLFNKLRLHSLELSWDHNAEIQAEMSAEVLENLRPPPDLKVLDIVGYKGYMFPPWLVNQGIVNLVKVSLIHCSCHELPPLGQLPYLKNLYIKGLLAVKSIGYEFYGNSIIRRFPSLKQLELSDLPNLLEWKSFEMEEPASLLGTGKTSSQVSKEAFPCLETLTVKGCSTLMGLPLIPSLKNLALCNSNEMLLYSLPQLPLLSSLVIEKFRGLSLPEVAKLDPVQKLTLYDCENLGSLFDGLQGFTSLKHLNIFHCDRLTSLPLGLRYLTSLEKLNIVECEQLADITETIQYLSMLEELIIEGCPTLVSLPACMHNLTSVRRLTIKRCPQLENRLEREIGEDWVKILHIPYVVIETGDSVTEEATVSN